LKKNVLASVLAKMNQCIGSERLAMRFMVRLFLSDAVITLELLAEILNISNDENYFQN